MAYPKDYASTPRFAQHYSLRLLATEIVVSYGLRLAAGFSFGSLFTTNCIAEVQFPQDRSNFLFQHLEEL
ncbi:MAG: hypothetical protein WBH28_21865 [Fuerstiella sp.]